MPRPFCGRKQWETQLQEGKGPLLAQRRMRKAGTPPLLTDSGNWQRNIEVSGGQTLNDSDLCFSISVVLCPDYCNAWVNIAVTPCGGLAAGWQ